MIKRAVQQSVVVALGMSVMSSAVWAGTCSGSAKKDIVSTAIAAGSFKTLAAALTAADLVSPLQGEGPFTVFAPTDAAFAQLPAGTVDMLLKPENRAMLQSILTYHVVPARVAAADVVTLSAADTLNGQRLAVKTADGQVMIDDATVSKTDIACSNGIIHVIDRVMIPTDQTIPQIAASAGSFNTLLQAAQAAGLVDALSGAGPLTVFAPTDDAFAALPEGTLTALLQPGNRQALADVLKYHVVSGRVFANQAVAAGRAKTLQNGTLRIGLQDGRLRINDAAVTSTDIDAANGVIHVIDRVLVPADLKLSAAPMSVTDAIALAIDRGAPLFNDGHHQACASIYEVTASTLLAAGTPQLNQRDREVLTMALAEMKNDHDARSQSWTLRHALDAVYQRSMTASR